MKLKTNKDLATLHTLIKHYYDSYNIIHDSKIDEDTVFMVVKKFFFRTSNRASLSIILKQRDDYTTLIEAVGSGGGQGMIFKFDWGAKESFEKAIPKILEKNEIAYRMLEQ